ncbi:hypothetical protein GE09DRAFT_1246444 [Coniochaeta sp. 2T2.1]|nr:hypothetical protein GE09DRAFT_1246444 [Coniochaeta sp. 2T2.1]
MTDQVPPTCREAVVKFILNHTPDAQAEIFQAFDSVMLYHHQLRVIIPLAQMAVQAWIAPAIPMLDSYLRAIPPQVLAEELVSLDVLRPNDIVPLPCLPRFIPSLAQLPSTLHDHTRSHGLVQNFQHAERLSAELMAANNKPGANCPDMPQTDWEWQALKDKLFMAIVDTSATIENANNAQVRKVQAMTNVEVEVLAWHILKLMRDAQYGIIGIPGTDVKYEAFPTFRGRFDAAKKACQDSKCTVTSLVQVDFAKRLVASPMSELARKVDNRAGNKLKAIQNKAGQKAIEVGDAVKRDDGAYTYRTGEQVAPAPPPSNGVEEAIKAARPKKRRRTAGNENQDSANA